jgi:hypothetical protein
MQNITPQDNNLQYNNIATNKPFRGTNKEQKRTQMVRIEKEKDKYIIEIEHPFPEEDLNELKRAIMRFSRLGN